MVEQPIHVDIAEIARGHRLSVAGGHLPRRGKLRDGSPPQERAKQKGNYEYPDIETRLLKHRKSPSLAPGENLEHHIKNILTHPYAAGNEWDI
jgi:hypothetical protein